MSDPLVAQLVTVLYLFWGALYAVIEGYGERVPGRSDAEGMARGLVVTAVWPLVMMWAFLRGRDGR
jgi:hypothetical protein